MIAIDCWKLYKALLGADPYHKASLVYYENLLELNLLEVCRQKSGCQAMTNGFEAIVRFHLGRGYARFRNNWKSARQQLQIALDLAETAHFYNSAKKLLPKHEIVENFWHKMAIIEYCGFKNLEGAFKNLDKIKSERHIHKAIATKARILVEIGEAEAGITKFVEADVRKLHGRNMKLFVMYLENSPLPPSLNLNALDLYE